MTTETTSITREKHCYAYSGDFSNRFSIAAFDRAEDRDQWMDAQRENENNTVRAITRREARRLMGAKYFDGCGVQDFREAIGCYLGSENENLDHDRWMEAKTGLDYVDGAFASPPVRL